MRRRLTAVLAAISVFAMAGTALAVTVAPELFTEGYDGTGDNHILVWGASQESDSCTLFVAGTTHPFETDVNGKVTKLDGTTPTTTPACTLNAFSVVGPNGQVNHGMVVSSFRRALREANIRGGGCVMRFIAQSSYGKDDQVQADPAFEPSSSSTTLVGSAELTTHAVTCGHGKPETTGQPQANANSHGGGRPEWAGQGHGPNH